MSQDSCEHFLGVNHLNVESRTFEVEVNHYSSIISNQRGTEIVRLNALNVLNMEKEVQVGEMVATLMALSAGVFLFCANMLIQISAQIATENNQNMAVVTAMANGTVPMCLLGSLLIYKEKLTVLQITGSLICLLGILTLSLPTVFIHNSSKDTSQVSEEGSN